MSFYVFFPTQNVPLPHPYLVIVFYLSLETGTQAYLFKMAARSTSLSSLPIIALAKIFSFLDREDVIRCCQVCSRFNQVASSPPMWKRWCKEVWLVEECPTDKTWKGLFFEWKASWGRYESCYASIKRAWIIIEEFTRVHCPGIHASLNDGLSEKEIDKTEQKKLNGKST